MARSNTTVIPSAVLCNSTELHTSCQRSLSLGRRSIACLKSFMNCRNSDLEDPTTAQRLRCSGGALKLPFRPMTARGSQPSSSSTSSKGFRRRGQAVRNWSMRIALRGGVRSTFFQRPSVASAFVQSDGSVRVRTVRFPCVTPLRIGRWRIGAVAYPQEHAPGPQYAGQARPDAPASVRAFFCPRQQQPPPAGRLAASAPRQGATAGRRPRYRGCLQRYRGRA
jgi:hypothetical protein